MPEPEEDNIAAILTYLREAFQGAELSHGWVDTHMYEFKMAHGGFVQKILATRTFLDARTPDGIIVFGHAHRLGQVMLRAGSRPVRVSDEGIIIQEKPQEPASP